MSSKTDLRNILFLTSEKLIEQINYVKQCDKLGTEIESFYSEKNKLVGESGPQLRIMVKGADYYRFKARSYFNFFGIDFEDYTNSKPIKTSSLEPKYLIDFTLSSIQLLYVNLWELMKVFLVPLGKLYHTRMVESKLLPEDLVVFPLFSPSEELEKLDLYDIITSPRQLFFRIEENLPFEIYIFFNASCYFKDCLQNGLKKLDVELSCEDCLSDFIRLSILRNNISHIGRQISMQETSEPSMQKQLFKLTTLLPRIQTSCLGLIKMFKCMKEVEETESK